MAEPIDDGPAFGLRFFPDGPRFIAYELHDGALTVWGYGNTPEDALFDAERYTELTRVQTCEVTEDFGALCTRLMGIGK